MSRKAASFIIIILSMILSSSFVLNKPKPVVVQDYRQLKLEVSPNKSTYLPGEPIQLQFTMTNNSNSDISLYKGSTVLDGYLRVSIANEDGNYNSYQGPEWGAKDTRYKEPFTLLKPGEDFKTEATILWNHAISTSHLNAEAAQQASQGYIKTEYALPGPGTYYVKALLGKPATTEVIESQPIRITVTEPYGADLEVWNKIKDNGSYAHFLHTGEFRESLSDFKAKQMISLLEGILTAHPTSRYSETISQALFKHRSGLEKLNRASHRPNN